MTIEEAQTSAFLLFHAYLFMALMDSDDSRSQLRRLILTEHFDCHLKKLIANLSAILLLHFSLIKQKSLSLILYNFIRTPFSVMVYSKCYSITIINN